MQSQVYLAGPGNQYDPWRSVIKKISGFKFYDPDTDSDQSSSKMFFPQDLTAIRNSKILIANPGTAPAEGTWIEIGYFHALNTKKPGDFCNNLIIIWNKDRVSWSIEFIKKTGHVVETVEEAIYKLQELKLQRLIY